ncbi:MAG: HEAT repeat domain-containing protein [Planctomycetota bacterium]
MFKRLIIVLGFILIFSALVQAEDVLPDLIWTLTSHKDPQMRETAATMLGTIKVKSAVKPLIDALSDENEGVRNAAHKSLVKITKQDLPLESAKWQEWWDKSGVNIYENVVSGSQEMAKLRSYLNVAFIVMILELVFIILFIIVFSFMGGAKIKEMKEINRRAETYIADADGVSRRFEQLIEDTERRRNEMNLYFDKLRNDITMFVGKLREDNQNEIERFADLVNQNLEHSLREAGRTLREKSEAELRQTLTLLKNDLENLVRKTVAEQLKQNKV